jgi:solute:Na+ symporter, SSS family
LTDSKSAFQAGCGRVAISFATVFRGSIRAQYRLWPTLLAGAFHAVEREGQNAPSVIELPSIASGMENGIHRLDWLIIGLYSLALIGIALYHSRRMCGQDDIFLAGRSMSRWPIAISMYMALFSTNSFLGVTGWVNRPDGTIWIGLQNIGIILAVPFIVWLYPTLFFRLRITSAYEYLDLRFNHAVRNAATTFFLGARLMWMSTILYSASLVVSMILGWTSEQGVPNGQLWAAVIIGALGTAFALIGGMRAVIWTDVMQFGVLMSGLTCMVVLGVRLSGGAGNVIRIGREFGRFTSPPAFSLTDDLSITGGLLLGFAGMLSSAGADQVVLQQYLTARSDREAKASLWRNGFLLKPLSLIYPVLGLIMFAYYRTHANVARLMRIPDDALPVFVVSVLPQGARGLMTMALTASVLTSVQSGLAAVSAAIQVNFVKPNLKRGLNDSESVLLARCLLFLNGLAITYGAYWIYTLGRHNSIIQILNMVMYPFAGVLLGIFLLGLLLDRANGPGVLIGGILGFLGTIALPAGRFLFPDSTSFQYLARISTFYYGSFGAVLTFAAGYLASYCFAPPAYVKINGLTRRRLPREVRQSSCSS